jgi:predicted MPP superfamily phosphohydrolase
VGVTGCIWVYPLLWLGLQAQELTSELRLVMAVLLGAGAVCIYLLFYILDRRVEAGAWMPVAQLSQLAYAFSLWAGLLLVLWIPIAGLARVFHLGEPIWLWPGHWLWIPTLLAAWGTAWTFLRHQSLRVMRIGEGSDGIRIVHLSDIHASPCMTGRDLDDLVRRTNALEPDLVLMTGDFVMPFSEAHHSYLVDALAGLQSPSYACPGNHDLPVLESLSTELEGVGVRWLVDCSEVLEIRGRRIELVGVNFHWTGAQAALLSTLSSLPPSSDVAHRILLAHDPRLFAWLPQGRFDLQLSGHTHGGQVGTDMFGIRWSVLRPLGVYDQGVFERNGCRLNVHRGNWHTGLPPRMGVASEIVQIDLS